MKPETEEFLYYLWWSVDGLLRPTWSNLNQSFEQWAWHNHLGHRVAELERRKLIESHPDRNVDRVVRLTDAGRRLALGAREPETRWNRPWDGMWRLIIFDLPIHARDLRLRLWRALRRNHFGFLQGSVWITPDPACDLRHVLGPAVIEAKTLVVMEGGPAAGERHQDLVHGAWDFGLIAKRYDRYLKFLSRPPPIGGNLAGWASEEVVAWRNAIEIDPLLPKPLLPKGYSGMAALHRRQEVFAALGRQTAALEARRG